MDFSRWFARPRPWAAGCAASLLWLAPSLADAQVPPMGLKEQVNAIVDEVVTAQLEIKVTRRRSKILRMKQDVFRVAVADPSILDFVAFGTREVEIIGKETGSTTVTLWVGDQLAPKLLSLLVTVVKDDAVDQQRRLEYAELESMLNELFPNSRVQLIPIADKLIVRGQARDEQEATQIMSVIRENSDQLGIGQGGGTLNLTSGGTAAQPFPDASQLPISSVINMLAIPGEKQVLLKVRIAELKRSAFRALGADVDFNINEFFLGSALGTTAGNAIFSGTFNDGSFNIVLRALMNNGSAKILAEPNLVTLSGQSATFLSGGEFAVPTVVGVGGAQAATTTFKGFGTAIAFTPTVLDKDRIRLQVSPTFSTLNKDNAVNGIFGLDTRSVTTTVDLREGQVLAIAGLLQEQQNGQIRRIPFLGSIPGLGTLASDKSMSRDETELIVLVSPVLVHSLESDQAPQILPGMEVTEPDDKRFFWYGDIEGPASCHHRSTVWPLFKRRLKDAGYDDIESIRNSQQYYMSGPFGFSE
jgi:pilus assembly protein CpaC